MEKKLPMGKTFNCHLGCVEMPSQILEIAIGDDYIICTCLDGTYMLKKKEPPEKGFLISKIDNQEKNA